MLFHLTVMYDMWWYVMIEKIKEEVKFKFETDIQRLYIN